jgi:hypothetical protein
MFGFHRPADSVFPAMNVDCAELPSDGGADADGQVELERL